MEKLSIYLNRRVFVMREQILSFQSRLLYRRKTKLFKESFFLLKIYPFSLINRLETASDVLVFFMSITHSSIFAKPSTGNLILQILEYCHCHML